MIKCANPECRAEMPDDAKFCGECGSPIQRSNRTTDELEDSYKRGVALFYSEERSEIEEGLELIYRAAESGHTEAQLTLGVIFRKGIRVQVKPEIALEYLEKAANGGSAKAAAHLGIMYFEGEGMEQNAETAVFWLKKAAEGGVAGAHLYLGDCYDEGFGVEEDSDMATKHYKAAALAGDAEAQFKMASRVEVDYDELLDFSRPAEDVSQAIRHDPDKWYLMAAKQGHRTAMFMCYMSCDKRGDVAEALKWLNKLAEEGSFEAQHLLALRYERGDGVRQDDFKAARWFLAAAEQGHDKAQYSIGLYYLKGEGVAKDFEKGVFWMRKAAEQGMAEAEEILDKLEDD